MTHQIFSIIKLSRIARRARPDWFSLAPGRMAEIAEKLDLDVGKMTTPVEITQEIYEKCVEPTLIQPTFVLDLPAELVPLAKSREDDSSLVDVF